MTAGQYDITIEQGATYSDTFRYALESGTPINLTGYTAKMQIRESYCSSPIATLTTENGKISITGATGTITVTLSKSETSLINITEGVYDLVLTTGTTSYRFIEGKAIINKGSTK